MDPLLEHYMPSLMALKKALPGRQPEVLESHLFMLCAFIKFKNKNNVPRFAFRMFIACWFVRCKTETLAVVRDFTFFTGTSNGSETF